MFDAQVDVPAVLVSMHDDETIGLTRIWPRADVKSNTYCQAFGRDLELAGDTTEIKLGGRRFYYEPNSL